MRYTDMGERDGIAIVRHQCGLIPIVHARDPDQLPDGHTICGHVFRPGVDELVPKGDAE